jgi:hypothetical protein
MPYINAVRDRTLSLWQSVVEERAARLGTGKADSELLAHPMATAATALASALDRGAPLSAPPRAAGPLAVSVSTGAWQCSKLALQLAWAKAQNDTHAVQQLQNAMAFSNCDTGWAETVETYLRYFQLDKGSIPYRSGGDYVLNFELPAQATVALIGDWGTGTDAALNLLAQVARKRPDVVLHLGDIYYSGTPFECQTRFLDNCRQILPAGVPVYSLAGNHDMYSGGTGYYWLVDQLGQQASYFCLRNQAWQFLAMDTGYNDFNPFTISTHVTTLTDVEAGWHRDKIQHAQSRKTVLLSHHQLFTAFDAIGGEAVNQNLLGTFQDLLGSVALWFWGHEHRLNIYAPHLGLERGRCLGCSAIPEFVTKDYFTPKFDVPLLPDPRSAKPIRLSDDGTIYNHAYAIMQLDGPRATVSYFQDSDEQHPLFVETV